MKYLLIVVVAVGMMASCVNKENGPDAGNTLEAKGSAAQAQLPPRDMQETAVLTSRFWVFEHWVDMDYPEDKVNKGRWYRFYEDGTYDGGHWEDHNDHGTWFLRKGAQHTNLFIDSEIDDMLDGKWQIQGVTGDSQAMSWVNTGEFGNKKSPMCKLMAMLSIPTKEQFGMN